MIMADILKIALLILATLLVFISYWVGAQALFPALVERTRTTYSRPFYITFVGILVSVPLGLVGIYLLRLPNPAIKIIGGLVLSLPVLLGLIGSAGLCQRIGAGLATPLDETQPWRRVLRGGLVLAPAYLLPFIGWFGLTLWTLISGCGAAVLACRSAKSSSPTLNTVSPQVTG
jgi:hypothetical protein